MTAPSTQVTTLLTQFGLTTAAEELVPRLTQAGHPEALPVLLEVLEAEAEARRQRRIARLRRAARLPPGKTFATLDTGRWPVPVVQLRISDDVDRRFRRKWITCFGRSGSPISAEVDRFRPNWITQFPGS